LKDRRWIEARIESFDAANPPARAVSAAVWNPRTRQRFERCAADPGSFAVGFRFAWNGCLRASPILALRPT